MLIYAHCTVYYNVPVKHENKISISALQNLRWNHRTDRYKNTINENDSELHYGISSKHTMVCNYMLNIMILAKAVLRYFVDKVVPIQNACVRKRRVTQQKIYWKGSKVNQFIYTLVCNYMPDIRILAKAALQIFCSQGCSYTNAGIWKRGISQPKISW